MSFFSRLWVKIKSIFSKPAYIPIEVKPVPKPEPVQTPGHEDINWDEWTMRAIDISQAFEGSDPWANITGNFDGAYLTCGALGFTWLYNNQPPMILEFVKRFGEDQAKALMPTKWAEYYNAAKLGEGGGAKIVASWSNGTNLVREPYRTELRNFWKSSGMRQIQIEKAWTMMGSFAMKKTLEGQTYFSLSAPQFSHFAYWFDQAVLNGQGNTIPFSRSQDMQVGDVIQWCRTVKGYCEDDIRRNAEIWSKMAFSADKRGLFVMACLRAKLSRVEFRPVTMMRRGTLCMGRGSVNGTMRDYPWA